MKNKLSLTLVLVISFAIYLFPQQDSIKLNTWLPTAAVGLNISQLALSNWTQGGENSITYTFNGTGGLLYKSTGWTFSNNLKFAYGRTKLGGTDFRTNDNELYLESVISKNIGWVVAPYFSNTVRSPLGVGYTYATDPPAEIAAFFDPGYVSQSVGFTYQKEQVFNTRLGIAVQETFTSKNTQFSDDPSTPNIEKFKAETGLESVTNGEYVLAQNMLFKSSLRLFSRFKTLDVWDVRWDNSIVAKINDYLNTSLSYLLIYQKDQSVKTQMKEGLQLGINYTIL
ncbi:MAG: DUF3078 domain-containing protein [Ignavibacteriaceae bacterium]